MTTQTRDGTRGIERLYLDFDSFFATAEQHFNPALRGRPVGVVPLDSPHTGCIAISREAKALGLKSMARITDARQLIPDMVFVVARHDVYVRLHDRILEVIDTCLPVAKVRSIDEVVCHLLPSEAREGERLARRIKRALAENFSDVLTCSIGMAPTELLAKIGAEMNKPDGFTLFDAGDLPLRLAHLPLGELPGISAGMEARLQAAGVRDFESLWRVAPKQARAIWGSVEGERFWNELHGTHAQRPETVKRMFGHSRMLPADWRSPEKLRQCARQLAIGAGRRLRRAELLATRLSLGFRGGERPMSRTCESGIRWDREARFPPARDDLRFLRALDDGLDVARREVTFSPRSVSVMLHGLVSADEVTEDLFGMHADVAGNGSAREERDRREGVSDVIDRLRAIHGPAAISMGPRGEVPGGYLGAKIAFGRIPDKADFGDAPVSDADTRFCSF
jgi:DNA polymerase-4